MQTVLDNVSLRLDFFIIMFIRISALIISSPIFGRKVLPNLLKIGLCLTTTYVLFAANINAAQPEYDGVIEFGVLCIKELLFGLVLWIYNDAILFVGTDIWPVY